MVPVSTALCETKWYHDFQPKWYVFKDKRGIYNGIRCEKLYYHGNDCACGKGCLLDPLTPDEKCFLTAYRKDLFSQDFQEFYTHCDRIADYIKQEEQIDHEMYIILMVHETNKNPCSERIVLQDWIRANGYDCPELKYPISQNYENI